VTAFLIVAGLLTVAALLFVLPPLLARQSAAGGNSRADMNRDVYRDQLRELDSERAAGRINETEYQNTRGEIERRLLDDEATAPSAAAGDYSRWPAIGLVLALPILAVSLYAGLGNVDGLDAKRAIPPREQAHAVTPEQIQAMVDGLAERLKTHPEDVEGWVMLARSYNALRRFADASAAFARAAALLPDNAVLLADYADTLAMANGRNLKGEPERIIAQALKADPNNIKALALAGTAAFEQKNYKGAIARWQHILELVPPDSQAARSVSNSVAEAQKLAGLPLTASAKLAIATPAAVTRNAVNASNSGGGQVSGTVTLAPALQARVAAGDTLFVFARAVNGPRLPLAILKQNAKDLPLRYTLDDSMAMAPGMTLSSVPSFVVGARVSKSGNATPQPGDLQGSSQPTKAGAKNIDIVIDADVK